MKLDANRDMTLLIFLETDSVIKGKVVADFFKKNSPSMPFKRINFLTIAKNETEIIAGEFWPQFGLKKFPLEMIAPLFNNP